MATVKFAVPKGSIEEATFKILEEAWQTVTGRGRTYRVKLSDPEIDVKILRPQEIPTYVQEGFYDIGITGKDWIREANADVKLVSFKESKNLVQGPEYKNDYLKNKRTYGKYQYIKVWAN